MARLASGVCVVGLSAARRAPGSAGQGQAEPCSPSISSELALSVTSVTSVSLDPPMVLFCVHGDARLREALDDVDTWAVSVLDAGGGPAADWLATPGRPSLGQLASVPHRHGRLTGAPLLAQSQAWVECRTVWIRAAGDHDVVVGRVLGVEVAPGARGALVHRLGRVRPLTD